MFDNSYLDTLSGDYKSFVPVTWWLLIGCARKDKTLVCGDLDIHSIRLIAFLSKRVFLVGCEKTPEAEKINNLEFIDRNAIAENSYDAVVINQRALNIPITDQELGTIIGKCLTDNATMCLYELSENLKSCITSPLKLLKLCFNPGRQQKLAALSSPCTLIRYPSISYTPRPYESFLPGRYHNNKNIFLLKERLKSTFLKTPFSRSITNSNIWIWCKSENSPSLLNQLYKTLNSTNIQWQGSNVEILKILYRPGKIIISLSSKRASSPEYIAVIAIDKSSEAQRNNEEIAINYLKKNNKIHPLISQFYMSMSFGFFKIYLMSEIDGITVDINNTSLQKMTKSAFNCIMLYSSEFIQSGARSCLKELSAAYFITFKSRYCNFNKEIKTINSFLEDVNFDDIPSMFMHGDAKLENFVLDRNFNVISMIDLELAEVSGFPLLDLYYLLVYNHNMQNNRQFNLSYIKLLNNDLDAYEQDLITKYCNQFSISEYHQEVLKIMFFIHHYSRRFRALAAEQQYQTTFGKCLTETCQFIEKLKNKQGHISNE